MAYSRYYRTVLAPVEKAAYDALVNGAARREDQITIPAITPAQVDRVIDAMNYDYPDLFYIDMKSIPYSISSTKIVVKMPYLFSFAEAVKLKKEIDHEASLILDGAKGLSPVEAEAYLHDALVRRCVYEVNPLHPAYAHNLIGPFLERKCVCEGYAKAFQFLADKVKLPSIVATGTANTPGEAPGGHAWNIVKLGGATYHLDVTFDHLIDGKYCARAYFNLSDSEIFRDHQTSPDFPLPKCATSGAVIPIVSSTAALIDYLRNESAKGSKFSEFRLTKSFTLQEIMEMIRRKITPADYGWYNSIEKMQMTGGYSLCIIWGKKGVTIPLPLRKLLG